jgi:Tetratricopeptide repeat.
MNRIAILAIILVSGGMYLLYFGQDVKNRFNSNQLHQSINEKIHRVDQLVNINNELNSKADQYQKVLSEKGTTISQLTEETEKQNVAAKEYQKSLSEKDKTIHMLTEQIGKHNVTAEEFRKNLSEKDETVYQLTEQLEKLNLASEEYQKGLSEKNTIIHQTTARVDNQKIAEEDKENLAKKDTTTKQHKSWFDKLFNLSASKQLADAQIETDPEDVTETEYGKVIAHARTLYSVGRYDDAYEIADDLRQNYPEDGLAYLILGTIEMHKEHCDNGDLLLDKAIKLGLTDKDEAWAFHNLGISSVRKKNYEKAEEYLAKAIELDPNMEKSETALKFINDYLQRKSLIREARRLCKMGKYDDAYGIADDLRQKYPEDGLPYFILGTIEMRKENYDKGEDLLNTAVKMEQSDEDKAWSFHNLGIFSARKNNIEKAREYLAKAVELNPDMMESKKALKLLDNLN